MNAFIETKGDAETDYVRLHLERETHFVRDTMSNFQHRLNKDEFIRIHRSTIVNVNKIVEILPMAELVRHRQTKGSAKDRLSLNHRATPRLHTSSELVLHISGKCVFYRDLARK